MASLTSSKLHLRLALLLPLCLISSGCGIRQFKAEIPQIKQRLIQGSTIAHTGLGDIEYGVSGTGIPVLALHGAGGGYDVGLLTAELFWGKDCMAIAPSRFGYLRTPYSGDSTPRQEADLYAQLLTSLGISKVFVLAASGGTFSAVEFAVRYPDRCRGLVLISAISKVTGKRRPVPAFSRFLISSDYRFWWATRHCKDVLLMTMGTPKSDYKKKTPQERELLDRLVNASNPVTLRKAGSIADWNKSESTDQPRIDSIRVPTLIIHSKDDKLVDYSAAVYGHEHIRGSQFVSFETGGHVMNGRIPEVRKAIHDFVSANQADTVKSTN